MRKLPSLSVINSKISLFFKELLPLEQRRRSICMQMQACILVEPPMVHKLADLKKKNIQSLDKSTACGANACLSGAIVLLKIYVKEGITSKV